MIKMRLLLSLIFAFPSPTIAFSSSSKLRNNYASSDYPAYAAKKSSHLASTATVVNGEDNTSITLPKIRLSVEEKAKTVISVCTSGTLCTSSSQEGIVGAPFGSFVDYVLDNDGNPILLMNEMSMHSLNIANNPDGMVTLFAQLGGKPDVDSDDSPRGQDVSRCSITGVIERIDLEEEADAIALLRVRYAIAHAYADQVMDSPRFHFNRIRPKKVYFVGGFGVLAKWVPVEEYINAASDILSGEASEIVSKLNRDHASDLLLTARHILDCVDVEMVRLTSLDRLGMDIRVTTMGKRKNQLNTDEFRVGFRIQVMSVEDAKSEVMKVFQEAWEKGNGYDWGEEDGALPGSDIPILKIAEDGLGLKR